MAKKSVKKSGSKKVASKGAKKAGVKKSAAKSPSKSSGGAKLVGMHAMGTGAGASPGEIAGAVVAHLNSGAHSDKPLWDKYWSDDVVSIEGVGMGMAWHGRKAMEEKCAQWMSENRVHGARATGPFVGSTGFAVLLEMDVETIKTGQRQAMKEIAVYTVQNGKVVREEFMYGE